MSESRDVFLCLAQHQLLTLALYLWRPRGLDVAGELGDLLGISARCFSRAFYSYIRFRSASKHLYNDASVYRLRINCPNGKYLSSGVTWIKALYFVSVCSSSAFLKIILMSASFM